MRQCRTCNEFKGLEEFDIRSDNGKYKTECKVCALLRHRKYNEDNREKIAEKNKKHSETHKEEIFIKRKNYRQNNKEKIAVAKHIYYEKNKDTISAKKKKHYEENKDVISEKQKDYNNNHKDGINERIRAKRADNIQFRLACVLRSRLRNALNGRIKVGSAIRDLGCSKEELQHHLESLFKDGMTWENYGLYGWHIDHIIPLSSFDLTDRQQFLKACHYTNLQPLWAEENLKKGSKISTKS